MAKPGRPELSPTKLARFALSTHLTEEEYRPLADAFRQSTFRRMSHYLRARLLSEPVTVLARDASLDELVEEIKRVKYELNAIGRNVNQLVLRQATQLTSRELVQLMGRIQVQQEEYLEVCSRLQKLFDQVAERWLQK